MGSVAQRMDQSNIPWWLVLLNGIAAILIGILLFVNTRATVTTLVVLLGVYWLIKGVFAIVSIFVDSTAWGWKLFIGILGVLAGLIIIQHPLYSTILVPAVAVVVLGIEGIIIGIIEVVQAFQGGGWGMGILGVISIILGIILVANPIPAGVALLIVFAVVAIIGGIAAIVIAFRMR